MTQELGRLCVILGSWAQGQERCQYRVARNWNIYIFIILYNALYKQRIIFNRSWLCCGNPRVHNFTLLHFHMFPYLIRLPIGIATDYGLDD
jgi:hypothetical protein